MSNDCPLTREQLIEFMRYMCRAAEIYDDQYADRNSIKDKYETEQGWLTVSTSSFVLVRLWASWFGRRDCTPDECYRDLSRDWMSRADQTNLRELEEMLQNAHRELLAMGIPLTVDWLGCKPRST
jgi:hypothetical protein